MKIKLLNDGNYGDMDNVKFPVEVEAVLLRNKTRAKVTGAELERIGGVNFKACAHWTFFAGEFEVITK